MNMDGFMLVWVEEDADSQILIKFRHDIYQMKFKQVTQMIITTWSSAPIPKHLRSPHRDILMCSQLTDDRAVCAPLQCPVYSWKSHSPWSYRSFICNWLVERKQLVVLTVATTALIDVVEQSHYGSAILWLMWAERSSENLIDCPHVWKTVLL